MTQQEQIIAAKRAYIVLLYQSNGAKGIARFAVYLDSGQGLELLSPSDGELCNLSKELLPGQVYSYSPKFPAFHFELDGYGYHKPSEIGRDLAKINPNLDVYDLTGLGYQPRPLGTRKGE